jgi:hypothetical protein
MKFLSTSSHGYLIITPNQLKVAMKKGYVPTAYSMFSKSQVLLEEDCDAGAYMKVMIPNDIERALKWKSIKEVYQNSINHNKYIGTPPTLKEFEAKLDFLTIQRKFVGMTMITTNGEKHKIISTQKNGYIYNDGQLWNMPLYRISEIVDTVED